MKLRLYSDLHLDHYNPDKLWYPPELPDDKETTLILAGDLWFGTKWIEYAGKSWISQVAPRFKKVIIVLGNHCYWPQGNLSILNGANKCNVMLQDMCLFNVYVLDMATHEDGEYLFVGATLWTDMNKGDPLAMFKMADYMRYDGKCAYETGPGGYFRRFTSEKWVQTHCKHRDYIKHVVTQNKDKKVIVVTHHLPLLNLGDPLYHGDPANCYYSSDLSDLILDNPQIKLWVYGHTHYQKDIVVGDTRLMNNCCGYQGEHMEQQGLIKHEVFEV